MRKIITCLLLLFILCACGQAEYEVRVNNDGTFDSDLKLVFPNEKIEDLGLTLEDVVAYTTYKDYTYEDNEGKQILTINDFSQGSAKTEIIESDITVEISPLELSDSVNLDVYNGGDYSYIKDVIEGNIIISMPNRIRSYNNGELIDEYTLKAPLFLEEPLKLTCKTKEYDEMIARYTLAAVVVTIVAFVCLFIFINKKLSKKPKQDL